MRDTYQVWYPFVIGALRVSFQLCGGFHVEGAENVPRTGSVIVAANHVSFADPPALGAALPRPAWFMAKEPLFRNRTLGWMLRTAHSFPVNQEGVDRHAIRFAQELLARGEALAMFPEGGTNPTGELQPFFPGLALIAIRSGAPVVPAALIGTNRVVPYAAILPRRARGGVTVRFGKPCDLAAPPPGLDRHGHLKWTTGRIREEIQSLLRGKGR